MTIIHALMQHGLFDANTIKADDKTYKQLPSDYSKNLDRLIESSITAQIKIILLFQKSTHALSTKVVTQDGVVTLSGEARNLAEKDLVTKLAANIQDVKRVNNQMTVQKP